MITWQMVERFFPVQTITISSSDKDWMTLKIKKKLNNPEAKSA